MNYFLSHRYRQHVLFSCFCIWFLYACKENKAEQNITNISKNTENQISRIFYGTDPDAEKWYEYNEKGDLIRQGMSVDTIVYEYAENKIIKRHLDKKHSWLSRIDYLTDQHDRIISSVRYDENDKEISTCEYIYNPDGYLIKNIELVKTSGSRYTNEFVYNAGNLTEVKTYGKNGQLSSRYVFTYYDDITNHLNMFMQHIFDDIFPKNRLGKMNKNLVRQLSNISKEGDTLSLLSFRYADTNNDSLMREYQSDVLNEFDTELTYRFNNK